MYTTTRYYYPHGNELECMDCTVKEWDDLEKAIAYCQRYAKGLRFASAEIEDEKGKVIYEILANGIVEMNLPEII